MTDKEYLERIRQLPREELEAALIREAELRRQWEDKALGMEPMAQEKDPCQSEVEKIEVVVQTCIRTTETGEVVSRHRRTWILDPQMYSLNESRQMEKEHGPSGEVTNMVPIGKPHLVLHGTVIGGQNDPLLEPQHPDLDVQVSKIANIIKMIFFWRGTRVLEYEVTEQALMVENMRHHTGLMVDKLLAEIGRDAVSPGQIRHGLLVAISNQMGIQIDQR
jgi:hypothetical protein